MSCGPPSDIRQETATVQAHGILLLPVGTLLAIYDLVVGEDYVVGRGSTHEEGQDSRDGRLAEVGGLVTVHTMTVHHAEHPEPRHPGQLTLDTVTVLINLAHLRDEASARLHTNLLNDLGHKRRQVCSTAIGMPFLLRGLLVWILRRWALPTNIYSREVSALLYVLVVVAPWIYFDKIVTTERR